MYAILIFQFSVLHSHEISIDCSSDCSELEKVLPAKFFVQSIDIQADYQVDKDELLYLIDISAMTYVSIQDLTKTVFYLKKKECFSKIEICYDQQDHKLVFKLEGMFILSSLRLHGSMVGKDSYRSCYIMETGECFDQKKHEYSLQKMKKMFHDTGFFRAEIQDKVLFDEHLKVVKIDLYLVKGPQFSIGDSCFEIESTGKIGSQDLDMIKKQLVRIFVKRFFSHKYTKAVIEKSIIHFKKYLHKKGLGQIDIVYDELLDNENKQVDLKFYLSFDDKKEFVFWGNHFFSQEILVENILMYGKSSWQFPGVILADEIENMYKARGFLDVKASVKEEKGRVFCIIHENFRTMLKRVEYKDNFHISAQKIESDCFASINNKFFDRDTFSSSVRLLKQLYMQHGFWDVKIVKEEFTVLKDIPSQKTVESKIILTLDEGSIRYLSGVEIKGYPDLMKEKPFVQFSDMKQPVPFNHSWITLQKNWLQGHFKDLGHLNVIVEYECIHQEQGDYLVWSIHLDEQQVYFGKFVVQGNSRIPFKYLQRELAIEQGQVWDKKKVQRSIDNLRNLNLFDSVHVYSHKEIDEQGQIPVGVKLIAADTYEIRTRIGGQQVGKDFSLQQGFSYKVGGTFMYNNPFKFGDRIVVDADFTRFYGNFSLQYLMPWLFHRPIRSQFKIYDNSYRQPLYIGSDVSMYNAYQKGILFGLQEKHDHVTIGSTLGLEFKGVLPADIADIAISLDCNPELFNTQFAYIFAEPSVMWSCVDNILNPTKGWSGFISFLPMLDLTNRTSLFKFIGESAFYAPLSHKSVFAIRLRLGHIFNREYVDILPIDRFYLGGANTIRGYDRDYCPPLGLLSQPVPAPSTGLPPAAQDLWRFVNQGGRTMFNCNFEVRFPIYAGLQGATFIDAGVLIKDNIADVPDNMLGGGGFGFRYDTPIGPLRFDIAFKFDRKYPEFESPYAWYLTLGQAF